jgi:hypothetical protein
MDSFYDFTAGAVALGIGATFIMDLWGIFAARVFGLPPPNYALVGRWVGHMHHGRFVHDKIAQAPAIAGEKILGWAVHYGTGVIFAAVLLAMAGVAWIQHPTLLPAVSVGVVTVAAPFLLMQPGMGAGIASRRVPNPVTTRLKSLLTHTVFGLGLYGAGWIMSAL